MSFDIILGEATTVRSRGVLEVGPIMNCGVGVHLCLINDHAMSKAINSSKNVAQ